MGLLSLLVDQEFLVAAFAAVAVFGTILTIALPYMERDLLGARLKSVAKRRDELRLKAREERERSGSLRRTPRGYMREVVNRLKLENLLDSPETRLKLAQAGYRGQAPLVTYMFFRVVMPVILFIAALVFLFLASEYAMPAFIKVAIAAAAALIGFYLPNVWVENVAQRRRESVSRAWPDALDLMLICVEAGMTVEVAFNKVAKEIGSQSVELAEELGLTTAELAYLSDRRIALENLGRRTNLEGVKAVVTSLIQSERYGTPLGHALRVMAQENRNMRIAAAEKKAGALPALLTVPMIGFFLPALFVVILGPAIIRIMSVM